MAKKRGTTDLCFVVGVDKPVGMSSHDVVNRCRRIFGERRVGHTGTLDPLASGVLPICVGPATRLDHYLTCDQKSYSVRIAFGFSTQTDDVEGEVLHTGTPSSDLYDSDYAKTYLEGLVGKHKQLPPVYSAIKVNGVKACDSARSGKIIELEPRDIEIYVANLNGIEVEEDSGLLVWDVDFEVSKGTYIRSIARDVGIELGCPAHVRGLRRLQSGRVELEDCYSLASLEELKDYPVLDPVMLLGCRYFFADGKLEAKVRNGNRINWSEIHAYKSLEPRDVYAECACTSGAVRSSESPREGELFCAVQANTLKALYSYDAKHDCLNTCCVFQRGVRRA